MVKIANAADLGTEVKPIAQSLVKLQVRGTIKLSTYLHFVTSNIVNKLYNFAFIPNNKRVNAFHVFFLGPKLNKVGEILRKLSEFENIEFDASHFTIHTCKHFATNNRFLAAMAVGVSDIMLNIFGVMIAGQIRRRKTNPLK